MHPRFGLVAFSNCMILAGFIFLFFLGEHTDWTSEYRNLNTDIPPGSILTFFYFLLVNASVTSIR
jgi:hypothetical protein